jgi:hypothetical protein
MAVVQPTIIAVNKKSRLIRWASMANGDTGAPIDLHGEFGDKCVQLTGTLSTGGAMTFQGSNIAGSSPTWATLRDASGSTIVMTSLGFAQVLENPYRVRPNITAGDGSTSLTVTLYMVD